MLADKRERGEARDQHRAAMRDIFLEVQPDAELCCADMWKVKQRV